MVQREVARPQLTPQQRELDAIQDVLKRSHATTNTRPAGEALNRLGQFIERNQGTQDANMARAWYLAGAAYESLGNNADAWHCYSGARAITDQNISEHDRRLYDGAPERIRPTLPGGQEPGYKDMLADTSGLPGIRGRTAVNVEDLALERVEAEQVKTPAGESLKPAAVDLKAARVRGRSLLVQDRFDEALGEFRPLRDRMGEMGETERYNYGNCYSKALMEAAKGATGEERKKLLQEALNLGRTLSEGEGVNVAQGHHIMAVALARAGQYDQSAEHAQLAYDGSAGHERLHAVAAGQLACNLRRQATRGGGELTDEQRERINGLHEEACNGFGNNAILWHNRSVFDANHRSREEAAQHATRAKDEVRKTPEQGGIYYSTNQRDTVLDNWANLTRSPRPETPPAQPSAPVAEGPAEEPSVPATGGGAQPRVEQRPEATHERQPAQPTPTARERPPAAAESPVEQAARGPQPTPRAPDEQAPGGPQPTPRAPDEHAPGQPDAAAGEPAPQRTRARTPSAAERRRQEQAAREQQERQAQTAREEQEQRERQEREQRERQAQTARETAVLNGLTTDYGAEHLTYGGAAVPANFEQASRHFERMTRSDNAGDRVLGHMGLGRIRGSQGNTVEAVDNYTAALESLPTEEGWRAAAGNRHLLRAEADCLLSLGDISRGGGIRREVSHGEYGVRRFGKYRKAMDFYDAAATLVEDETLGWGDNQQDLDGLRTKAYMGRGLTHTEKGRHQEAGVEYANALGVNGGNREALEGLRSSAERTENNWLSEVCGRHIQDGSEFNPAEYELSQTDAVRSFNEAVRSHKSGSKHISYVTPHLERLRGMYREGALAGDRVVGEHIIGAYGDLASWARTDLNFEPTFYGMRDTLNSGIFANAPELERDMRQLTAATGLKWAGIRQEAYESAGTRGKHHAGQQYRTASREVEGLCRELNVDYDTVMTQINAGTSVDDIRQRLTQAQV